jgi:hypothetical protein
MDAEIPREWAETLDAFAAHLGNAYESERTPAHYLRHVRMFAESVRVLPADLQPLQFPAYIASKKSWGNSTKKNVQQALKAFGKWADAERITDRDLTSTWVTIKATPKQTRPARRHEIDAARKKATPEVRLMIDLMAEAGLSPQEVAESHSRDLEPIDSVWWLTVRARAGRPRRSARIPGRLAQTLLAQPDGYFFPGKRDGHMGPATISRYVSQVLPPGVSANAVRGAQKIEATGRRTEQSRTEPRRFRANNRSRLRSDADFLTPGVLLEELNAVEAQIETSPPRAISECKVLLETLFASVLAERAQPANLGDNPKLGAYYSLVARALGIDAESAPDPTDADGSIKTVLRSLSSVVHQLALIRNDIGRGHGDVTPSPAERRHAYLAFNSTMAVAEFVLENWQIVREREETRPPDAPRG